MSKIGNIVLGGVLGLGTLFLFTGAIAGFTLNGKVSIDFEDLGLEIKEKKYTVSWVDCDGTVLEEDTELTSGSKAFYNGMEPTKEGFTFLGWDQAELSVNDFYYVVVNEANITCTAVYEEVSYDSSSVMRHVY